MKKLDSWEILSIFVRRWKLFLLSFLLVFGLGCIWIFKSSAASQVLAKNSNIQVEANETKDEKIEKQPKKSAKPKVYKLHFGIKNFNNQPVVSNQHLHTMFSQDFEYRKKKFAALSRDFNCTSETDVEVDDEVVGDLITKREAVCVMSQCYSTLTQVASMPTLYTLSFTAQDSTDAQQCAEDIVSSINKNKSLKTLEAQIKQFYLSSKPLAAKSQNIDWRLVELDFASQGILTYNLEDLEDLEDRPIVQTSTKAKFILIFFSSLIFASILVLTREFFVQNWHRIAPKEN